LLCLFEISNSTLLLLLLLLLLLRLLLLLVLRLLMRLLPILLFLLLLFLMPLLQWPNRCRIPEEFQSNHGIRSVPLVAYFFLFAAPGSLNCAFICAWFYG